MQYANRAEKHSSRDGTRPAYRAPMRIRLGVAVGLGLLVAPVARTHAQPPPTPDQPTDLPADPPPAPVPLGAVVDVTGTIVDASTGKPIRRALIQVEGAEDGVKPDENGVFVLTDVAVGSTLVVTADGFEAAIVTVETATVGDIPLLPEGTAGEIIDVAGEAPAQAVGATTLDRDEISHVPGSGNDILAGLDALPGITSNPFGGPTSFNGVVIRGSAPEDSKVLVDGFEVPFLYHTVGFRSILPSEAIESLEYLPGGFDVAYGRASSGIINVTTRGGTHKAGGHAELSVIDGGVLAHGPAGAGGTFLFAMRRSTIDLILPSLIPDDADINLTTVPRYYDLQGRVDYDLGRWSVSAALLGSDDVLQLFADDEEDPDQRFYARTRFMRLTTTARWAKEKWAVVAALSPSIQQLVFEFGRDQYFDMVATGLGARVEATHTSDSLGLKQLVARVGAEANIGRADLDLALPRAPDEGQPMAGPPTEDEVEQRFKGVQWVPDLGAWVAAAANLDPNVRMTTGIRVDAFLRSSDVAVQPRGELSMKLPRKYTLRFAAGAYRRPPENNDEFLNDKIEPEKATQLVLGAEREPIPGLKIQVSTYYTDRTQLITRGIDGEYYNTGRGTTYGAEMMTTLRRGPWFGWVSYTLSRSTRVDRPGERRRLFDFDQTHDLNVALSWKSKKWQFGGRFRLTSGQPTTPVLGSVYDSDDDVYLPVYGDVNSQRKPMHHQMDIRIDRTWKIGAMKLSAFLDVQNVYLNASVVGDQYSFDYSERTDVESLPILPSIGLRGEL
jgi:outer membrane receptor protein involved in Fe transport